MSTLLAQRNAEGIVTMNTGDGAVSAKIPKTQSMLGMVGLNGLINGAVYKEDGWVYFNNQPVRKWHVTVERYRLWEPKLNDLPALYTLYKQTQTANNEAWKRIQEVLHRLWKGHKVGDEVKAHAYPRHFVGNSIDNEKWWEYSIHNYQGEGLSYGFQWVKKPKVLHYNKLGKKLYELERRWWDTTCRRACKVKTVFYEAMKRSLPKPKENQVISLQFGEDTFWFYVVMHRNYPVWTMFDDQFKFTIKKIV